MPKAKPIQKTRKKDSGVERRILDYFRPYWRLFALGLLCTTIIKGIDLLFAFLLGDVIRSAIGSNQHKLDMVAVAIVAIHIIKWGFTYSQTYVISSATQRISVRLRNDLY